ncbi:hypothetical protein VYU27_010197, partial [Nannochloropsis oceanica]
PCPPPSFLQLLADHGVPFLEALATVLTDLPVPENDSARFSLVRSSLAPLTTWEEEGLEGTLSLLEELTMEAFSAHEEEDEEEEGGGRGAGREDKEEEEGSLLQLRTCFLLFHLAPPSSSTSLAVLAEQGLRQVHNKIKRQQQQQQQHHHEQRRSCPSPPPALLSLALACLSLLVETEGGREGGKEVALELYVSLREGLGGAFLETPPSPLIQRYHLLLLSLLLGHTGRRRKGGREGGGEVGVDEEADRLAFLLGFINRGPPIRAIICGPLLLRFLPPSLPLPYTPSSSSFSFSSPSSPSSPLPASQERSHRLDVWEPALLHRREGGRESGGEEAPNMARLAPLVLSLAVSGFPRMRQTAVQLARQVVDVSPSVGRALLSFLLARLRSLLEDALVDVAAAGSSSDDCSRALPRLEGVVALLHAVVREGSPMGALLLLEQGEAHTFPLLCACLLLPPSSLPPSLPLARKVVALLSLLADPGFLH